MKQPNPLPVLLFTEAVVRGGAEEHILMLLRGVNRTLFKPYFACTAELAERLRPDLPEDVEVIPVGLREPTQIRRMLRLGRVLRDRRIQILHSHAFYSSLCASAVGRLSGVPVIIETAHGREAWRKGWKSSFFVDRMVGRFVDRYIAVSEANAQYLIHDKRLPAKKISVIYPGSDLRKFSPAHRAPNGLAESAGIQSGDSVIVFVGRLEPQKGHRVLLDAMPAIREVFPRVKLICAGEGSLRVELEQKTRELRLEDAVRFVGYPSDVRDWLALATMTVLPSFYEGLPVTPIESLASGKPVVATSVDGTPEVVVNEKTGLIVPPNDPARLSEAICRMLREPDLADRLARDGREWVLSHFSVERLVKRTEEFYLESWNQRRRQPNTGRESIRTAEPAIPQKDYV